MPHPLDTRHAVDAVAGLLEEITVRRYGTADDDGVVEMLSVADGIHLVLADALEEAGNADGAAYLRRGTPHDDRLPVNDLYRAAGLSACPVCRPLFFSFGCVGCNGVRRVALGSAAVDLSTLMTRRTVRLTAGLPVADLFDPSPTAFVFGRDGVVATKAALFRHITVNSARINWVSDNLTAEDMKEAGPCDPPSRPWLAGLLAGDVLVRSWRCDVRFVPGDHMEFNYTTS